MNIARREAVSPSESLVETLHSWVAFGIMPIFALANAGVSLTGMHFDLPALNVPTGVAVGLFVGKPIGVPLAIGLMLKLRVGTLPAGLSIRHLLVLGLVAGVGFTMALFVAQLAFTEPPLLAAAKVGVLLASGSAALGPRTASGIAPSRGRRVRPRDGVVDSALTRSAQKARQQSENPAAARIAPAAQVERCCDEAARSGHTPEEGKHAQLFSARPRRAAGQDRHRSGGDRRSQQTRSTWVGREHPGTLLAHTVHVIAREAPKTPALHALRCADLFPPRA